MATNSDQNPEKKPSTSGLDEALDDGAGDPLNFDEIDKAIGDADPQFLNSVSQIKIDTKGLNLDIDESAGPSRVFQLPRLSLKQQLKKPFQFRDNPKLFTKFWGSVLALSLIIFITWYNQRSLISDKLFIQSLGELAPQVNEYNPITETEFFYDNPKFSKNLMTVSRMVVNLKESENSGPTPMLAMEINVEGLSAEAIIELKDREAEFKDFLLRFTEEKSYDDLVTAQGKLDLCEDFRGLINTHLTQGQVRKVFLNSFIIKP